MSEPLDLVGAMVARLAEYRAELGLRAVSGVLELAGLVETNALPAALPCAYVVELGADAAPPQTRTGRWSQELTERAGVVLLARHAGDRDGGKVRQALTPLLHGVMATCMGWTPPGARRPLVLTRSRLVGLNAGTAFYQLDFAADWVVSLTPTGAP